MKTPEVAIQNSQIGDNEINFFLNKLLAVMLSSIRFSFWANGKELITHSFIYSFYQPTKFLTYFSKFKFPLTLSVLSAHNILCAFYWC